MEKHYDTLRFEIFDPYEAKETWAVEFDKRNWHSVKIFVNDNELNALLVGLEDKEKGVVTPTNPANEYGHNGVYIVDQLESDYADSYGASVCCCAGCGEEGCWGIRVKVRKSICHTHTAVLNFTLNAMLTTPKSENFNSGQNNININSPGSN